MFGPKLLCALGLSDDLVFLGIHPWLLPWCYRHSHSAISRIPKVRHERVGRGSRQRNRGNNFEAVRRLVDPRFPPSPRLKRVIPSTNSTKCMAGIWGLAGYPLAGLHRILTESLGRTQEHHIALSRIAQGYDEMRQSSAEERAKVTRQWRVLRSHLEDGH